VSSLAELNAWLEDQCIAYAKRHQHPEFKDRTIWDVFQDERASLMELRGPFDGFVEKAVRASSTCLIMADHNRYSAVRQLHVRRRVPARDLRQYGDGLRAGFVTAAARAGADVWKIRQVSRHRSMQVLSGYMRDARLFDDHAGELFL
jgi:hypothetical protein